MHLPEFNLPDRKTWSAALSPSNLAMAVLVGFLCVGQATDWKMLGRKAKANSTVKLGAPDMTAKTSSAVAYRARHLRAGSTRTAATRGPAATRTDPNAEEVADRRPAARDDQNSTRQLD